MEVAIVASFDRDGADHLGLYLPGPDNGPVDRLQQAVKLLLPHIQHLDRLLATLADRPAQAENEFTPIARRLRRA